MGWHCGTASEPCSAAPAPHRALVCALAALLLQASLQTALALPLVGIGGLNQQYALGMTYDIYLHISNLSMWFRSRPLYFLSIFMLMYIWLETAESSSSRVITISMGALHSIPDSWLILANPAEYSHSISLALCSPFKYIQINK